MNVKDLEIPFAEDRGRAYRFFEILPGLLSLTLFLIPVILSIFYVTAAALFIIIYILVLLVRATAMSIRVIEGYSNVKKTRRVDWEARLKDFYDPTDAAARYKNSKNE